MQLLASTLVLDASRRSFVRNWLADTSDLLKQGEFGAARYTVTILSKKLRAWSPMN